MILFNTTQALDILSKRPLNAAKSKSYKMLWKRLNLLARILADRTHLWQKSPEMVFFGQVKALKW